MNIRITEDYRLTSDPYNFIVEKRSIAGEKAKNPGEELWKQISCHGSAERACKAVLKHRLLDSDAQSLQELIAVCRSTQEAIEASVSCLSQ